MNLNIRRDFESEPGRACVRCVGVMGGVVRERCVCGVSLLSRSLTYCEECVPLSLTFSRSRHAHSFYALTSTIGRRSC